MERLRKAIRLIRESFQGFTLADLRWSHISIPVALIVAAIIQWTMADGWQVWPMVPVVVMLVFVNEYADRIGQGIPPFEVYFFVAFIAVVWGLTVVILSKVNVFIQLLGVAVMAYFAAQGYIKQRERMRIIAFRRAEGQCVYCGEPSPPEVLICENCGEEVDPERSSVARTQSIGLFGKKTDRARGVLTPQSLGNIAANKEKALLANSPRRRGKPPRR